MKIGADKVVQVEDDNKTLRDKLILSQLAHIEEIINFKFNMVDKKIDEVIQNQNQFENRLRQVEDDNKTCPIHAIEERIQQVEDETDLIRSFARNSAFFKLVIYLLLTLFSANSVISFITQIKHFIK